jgi:hypothetical protein
LLFLKPHYFSAILPAAAATIAAAANLIAAAAEMRVAAIFNFWPLPLTKIAATMF